MAKKKKNNAEMLAQYDVLMQAGQTYFNFDEETGVELQQPDDDEYPTIDVDSVDFADAPGEADNCDWTPEELEEGYKQETAFQKALLEDYEKEIYGEGQKRAKEWLESAKLMEAAGGLDEFKAMAPEDSDTEQLEENEENDDFETEAVKEAKKFQAAESSLIGMMSEMGMFAGVPGITDADEKEAIQNSTQEQTNEEYEEAQEIEEQADNTDAANSCDAEEDTQENETETEEKTEAAQQPSADEQADDKNQQPEKTGEDKSQKNKNIRAVASEGKKQHDVFPDRIITDKFNFSMGKEDAFGCGVNSVSGGFKDREEPASQLGNQQQPAVGDNSSNQQQQRQQPQEEQGQKKEEKQPKIKPFGGKNWFFKLAFVLVGLYGVYLFATHTGADDTVAETKKVSDRAAAVAPRKIDDAVALSREQAAREHAARQQMGGNTGGQGGNSDFLLDGGTQQPQGGQPGQGGQQQQAFDNELRPEAAKTDVTQDPVYQQKMALKQQYIELMRQTYTSSPQVQGGWTKDSVNNSQADNSQNGFLSGGQSGNDRLAALNKIAQQANEAARQAQANIASGAAFKNNGGGGGGGSGGTVSSAINSLTAALGNSGGSQSGKQAFFESGSSGKGYLGNTRTAKIAPYTLPAGTMIPAALISGINTDLPGNITASVTENVFDWQSANVCLIPQGTRLFGTYSSSVSFGQKRVQISWQRLIYPDGSTISLEGMSGVDRRGYSGLKDKTYNHYTKMFMATLMTTAFTLLPTLVENRNNNGSTSVYYGNSVTETAASRAAQAIGSMGNKFFDKALNQNPTIQIRPGKRFNVQVNADIPFYSAWKIMGR